MPAPSLFPRAAVVAVALSLGALATSAEAVEVVVYNDSGSVIETVHARPVIEGTRDEGFLGFPLDGGPIQPGGSLVSSVTEEFCTFDLTVTFRANAEVTEGIERWDVNLCWTPIVVVESGGYINLQ